MANTTEEVENLVAAQQDVDAELEENWFNGRLRRSPAPRVRRFPRALPVVRLGAMLSSSEQSVRGQRMV